MASVDVNKINVKKPAVTSFMDLTSYAYGLCDVHHKEVQSSSSDSIQSALEATESFNVTEEYFSACNSIPPPEAFKTAISSSSSLDEQEYGLPDLLRNVQGTIDHLSRSWEKVPKLLDPLESTQSTPIKAAKSNVGADICYPKPMVEEGLMPGRKKWGSSDDRKIARVVHELVMEKYEVSYSKLVQKLRKLKLSPEENQFRTIIAELQFMFAHGGEGQLGSSQILQNVMASKKKGDFYKEFADGKLQRNVSILSKESDYDEHKFLQNAIGEELSRAQSFEEYECPPTTSIGTDDVSCLLSSNSSLAAIKKRKRKCRKSIISNSYYEASTVGLDMNGSRELVNEPFRYSYISYEDVTNLGQEIYSDEGKKQLKKHIFINDTIISQTEKMLKYGVKKTSNFIGSYMHLEAERILLVSQMRRQLLINYLYKLPEAPLEAVAKVNIENLRCIINNTPDELLVQHKCQQYFVCILQHKTTVYSTRIAAPNKLGWVDFGGFFIFDNVSNTFNIKVELYSITIPKRGVQSCFVLPFLKSSDKLPMMQLIGEVHIGMLNINNKKFTFKNSDNLKSREHKLTASIDASMNWPDTLKGFITVGTSKLNRLPVWNRRWCVLEDCTLKYYNYPSDETFCPPLGSVDLRSCKGYDEAPEKCLNNTTLRLILDEAHEFKTILLSPDTAKEYAQWTKHISIILTLIEQWNALKRT